MIQYFQKHVTLAYLSSEMNYLIKCGYDIYQVLPYTYYSGTEYIIVYFIRRED